MRVDLVQPEAVQKTPPSHLPDASGDQSTFPQDLLQALSVSPQTTTPGPEPPFLPPRLTRGAEEAAKVPKLPSQKLDSPRTEPDQTKVVQPQPVALNGAVLQSAQQALVALNVPKTPRPEPKTEAVSARPGAAVQKPADNPTSKIKKADAAEPAKAEEPSDGPRADAPARPAVPPPSVSPPELPKDPETPIVSVKQIAQPAPEAPQPVKPVSTTPKSEPATPEIAATAKAATGAGGQSTSFGGGGRQRSPSDRQSAPTPIATGQVSAAKTQAVIKPAELEGLKGLDRVSLVRQVADKLQALAASRSKEGVIVQLAPKALGTITLTVKSQGSSVDANISATDDQVRKAIELSRPDLAQAMQSRGYHLISVTVSTGPGPSGQNPDHQQLAQPRPQPQPLIDPPRSESAKAPVRIASPATPNGVDVWI